MTPHRPVRARTVHALWRDQPGLYRGFLVDVATAVLIGLLLLVGGRLVTEGRAWAVVNANGGPLAWGVAFLLAGVLLALTANLAARLMIVMLWLLALGYLVLALSFLASTLADTSPALAVIGPLLTARCAFMHVSRAQAYREGRGWTR